MDILFYIFGAIIVIAPLVAGLLLKFNPPKKINSFCAFNTKTTRNSQEAWDYAQALCSKVLLIYSAFAIVVFIVFAIAAATSLCPFLAYKVFVMLVLGVVLTIIGVIVTTIIVQLKTKKFIAKV